MKILHITTWFPNDKNPKEALWIKRHVDALGEQVDSKIWHVRTIEKEPFKNEKGSKSNLYYWWISIPSNRWLLIEIITFLQLFYLGLKKRKEIKKVDVINFHIAYPSLTFWKWLKPLYKKPIVITEHWSAYHFNFWTVKKPPRIQKIFRQNIPVITVSQSLKKDIEAFSERSILGKVIPNIVDTTVFNYQNAEVKKNSFFMVSQWKTPKNPIEVIKQFKLFKAENVNSELVIGGYGYLVEDMLAYIKEEKLEDCVKFIGMLDSKEIAQWLNKSTAFIHFSNYETFSVVCAEAICCGCPVIASKVGGIRELISEENGILLDNEVELKEAFKKVTELNYNREKIALNAFNRFSIEKVGEQYKNYLESLIES